ncbi:hypothetical protein [Saccharothrix violaceirubra]|uniref:Uncharacterized protein n=1 Tax=Saccharothrix violaceirubra TaxID=413306 RepID=A0A7W7WUJ6_9PSEU|nr:hypothetical protein [Saccharothrix violaceirubra]MBB4963453.1 hypothetical protein [Saccharothrix violaceirubra]
MRWRGVRADAAAALWTGVGRRVSVGSVPGLVIRPTRRLKLREVEPPRPADAPPWWPAVTIHRGAAAAVVRVIAHGWVTVALPPPMTRGGARSRR